MVVSSGQAKQAIIYISIIYTIRFHVSIQYVIIMPVLHFLLTTMSPKNNKNAFSHLIFCALTALYLARKDNLVSSSYAENIFLLRWLSQARKQKRFPKSVAKDIDLLTTVGQKHGKSGGLRQVLERLWLEENPHALMRLTTAIESLVSSGWENAVISTEEWDSGTLQHEGNGPAFFVRKSALIEGFSEKGDMINPVDFQVYGEIELFIKTLGEHNLTVEHQPTVSCSHALVRLIP